ncbi:DNA internalization-related competence protein ComEC/Rec2 [Bacillus changyiensis]|uniref:DNA internalization-related competence protein ComEC/Rec2 n=1 Tax=Bacillus changyiensis TaxID=3004103 RepID=UPI0022E40442|nr:DNA internalization-related competence protein ComEC/Rec2 [Bacillus changyiensis]MDA1474770.1 DNA internalization-related competence protein ComEC/Rec2 [Bacillus changyiensis]
MDMYRLIPCGAISAVAGIASAQSSSFLPVAIFLCLLLISCLPRKQFILFVICIFVFALYVIYFLIMDHSNTTYYQEGPFHTKASVLNIPKIDGDRFTFIAETADKERLKVNYTIRSPEEKTVLSILKPNSSCFFTGQLRKPKKATVPGTFGAYEYLYQQGIHWNYKLKSITNCKSDESSFLLNIRQTGLAFIEKNMPEQAAGIVQALIFGERFLIEKEVLDSYQILGIIHLLAISGLHVAIFSTTIFYTLLRIGITRETAKVFLIIFLPVLTVLTGCAPSVLRAVLMSEIYLLSSLLKKRLKTADVLGLACLGLLLYNPYLLFQVGFQLSFSICFVFILSKDIFIKLKYRISQLLLASFLAQLGSLPILLYHFQTFSLLSIFMNLMFVPFYIYMIIPLVLGSILALLIVHPLGEMIVNVLDALIRWSHQVATAASSVDVFTFAAVKPGHLQLLFYSVSICVLLVYMEKALSLQKLIAPLCCFFVVLLFHLATPFLKQEGEVTMIDVGQGDSMYVSAPGQNGTVLIDTGGIVSFDNEDWRKRKKEFSLGDRVLIPFLSSKGVKKLDALILTHADQDHIGEAETLIKKNKINKLIVPKGYAVQLADENLLHLALKKGIEVKVVKRGDRLEIGDLKFYVLSPDKIDRNSRNNSSLVLWMMAGGFSWLLTGDLEKEGERQIIETYPHLKADVLKVGHHGSKGSTGEELVAQIKPKIALISAGENNRYHHPHFEVLKILKRHHVKVMRTDRDGTIQYLFGKRGGTFFLHPPYDKISSS